MKEALKSEKEKNKKETENEVPAYNCNCPLIIFNIEVVENNEILG